MQDPSMATAFQTTKPRYREMEEQEQLKCPRCDSNNTKFCYYNNYNLSQPRHFCKNCRRYWTKGGTLRNIPVGGGTRKSSKQISSSSTSSTVACNPPPKLPKVEHLSATPPTAGAAVATEHDRQVVDVGGSFSSLLAANSHFGSFVESFQHGGTHRSTDVSGGELSGSSSSSGAPPMVPTPESFLGLDSIYWNGGELWSDISVYTAPGSSFQ